MRKITLELLNSFRPKPCYNPEEIGFTSDLELTPLEFIDRFIDQVKIKKNIIWVLVRTEFLSDKDLRLFAVWCAREALKLIKDPDTRSVEACDVAEKFANGLATKEELADAADSAYAATDAADAAYAATDAADYAYAYAAAAAAAAYATDDAAAASYASYAAAAAAAAAAVDNQIEKLKEFFIKQ